MTEPVYHPCLDENGARVIVSHPSVSTAKDTWTDANAVATLSRTAEADLPEAINGIAFDDTLSIPEEDPFLWRKLAPDVVAGEPDFVLPPGFRLTSGCVVIEPDRRIWIVHPTNAFMGVEATYPKGRLEPVLSLAQNAVKETWEESGLMVEPFAFLADIGRRIVVTRYYLARRTGGSPALAGWESQAVSLMPFEAVVRTVNRENDRRLFPYIEAYLKNLG